jgi:hypothetical protein
MKANENGTSNDLTTQYQWLIFHLHPFQRLGFFPFPNKVLAAGSPDVEFVRLGNYLSMLRVFVVCLITVNGVGTPIVMGRIGSFY